MGHLEWLAFYFLTLCIFLLINAMSSSAVLINLTQKKKSLIQLHGQLEGLILIRAWKSMKKTTLIDQRRAG